MEKWHRGSVRLSVDLHHCQARPQLARALLCQEPGSDWYNVLWSEDTFAWGMTNSIYHWKFKGRVYFDFQERRLSGIIFSKLNVPWGRPSCHIILPYKFAVICGMTSEKGEIEAVSLYAARCYQVAVTLHVRLDIDVRIFPSFSPVNRELIVVYGPVWASDGVGG